MRRSPPESGDAAMRLMLGALILFASTGFAFSNGGLLTDPDTWWHIKVGSDIWATGQFPIVDSYSYTYAGKPWIAKEWLGQIILYGGYALAGWNGVWLAGALSIGVSAVLLYALVTRHLTPVAGAALTLLALLAASDYFLARPFLFAIPISVAWTYFLFRSADEGRAPHFASLLLIVLWANIHAMFTLGFVVAFFAFLVYLENKRLSDRRTIALWIAFLALCPVVTLLHPYGYKAILATFTLTGDNDSIKYIQEWKPFNPQRRFTQEFALLTFLFAALVAGVRLGVARAALVVFLLHLFLNHHRFGSVLFPLLPVIVAPAIATRMRDRLQMASRNATAIDAAIARIGRPAAVALSAGAVAVYAVILFVLHVKHEAPRGADAIAYVKKAGITGNVMNDYLFGGPLIFFGIPTYIDGRTDQLFFGQLLDEDQSMLGTNGSEIFSAALEKYDVQWTLFTPDSPRANYLDAMSGWCLAYGDRHAVVHQRCSRN